MRKRNLLGFLPVVVLAWMAAGAAAAPKGKIIFGMGGEPATFEPNVVTGPTISMTHLLVFDTLVFRDPSGKITPQLAESWRLVEPKVWEFKLREGVKFANGEPVDAHAVKFSLERIIDPKLKSRLISFFRSIGRVEVVDRYTARIHTKYPDMLLLTVLSQYGLIVPPRYYASHDLKHTSVNPVGSGPYRLARWKKGEELLFEAIPGHRDPSRQRVKTGVVKIIPEPTTRVAALLAGDVDIVEGVPPQLVSLVKANPAAEIVSGPSTSICYMTMVIKPGAPWVDVRVRRALNLAVDRDSLINHVLRGYAKKVAVNVGPESYGFNPDLKPYPYDPEQAKKLLAEAGFPDGFNAEHLVPLGFYLMDKQVAEAIGGQMAKVGVKVDTQTLEYGSVVKRDTVRWEPHSKPYWRFTCRRDLLLHSEMMYAGAIHSTSTWGGYREKWMDDLIEDARSEPDDAKRLRKYQEINRRVYEQAPLIFLYQVDQITGKKKRVDWKMRADNNILLFEAGWKD